MSKELRFSEGDMVMATGQPPINPETGVPYNSINAKSAGERGRIIEYLGDQFPFPYGVVFENSEGVAHFQASELAPVASADDAPDADAPTYEQLQAELAAANVRVAALEDIALTTWELARCFMTGNWRRVNIGYPVMQLTLTVDDKVHAEMQSELWGAETVAIVTEIRDRKKQTTASE